MTDRSTISTIAVGSHNPIKLSAVEKAFIYRLGGDITVIPVSVTSGVSDQPFGDEVKHGAENELGPPEKKM